MLQLHLAAARLVGQSERGLEQSGGARGSKVEEAWGAQADGGQEIQRGRFKESDQ